MTQQVTVLSPQVVRKKQEMRARGSALRHGGHKPLHIDELPLPTTRSHKNSFGITLVDCNAKAFTKWSKKWSGSAEIQDSNGAVVTTLPLEGQKYKDLKALFSFLRVQTGSKLLMRHVF